MSVNCYYASIGKNKKKKNKDRNTSNHYSVCSILQTNINIYPGSKGALRLQHQHQTGQVLGAVNQQTGLPVWLTLQVMTHLSADIKPKFCYCTPHWFGHWTPRTTEFVHHCEECIGGSCLEEEEETEVLMKKSLCYDKLSVHIA